MTSRRWMIVVALAAVALASVKVRQRRNESLALVQVHSQMERLFQEGQAGYGGPGQARTWSMRNPRKAAYHAQLRRKYEHAASHPWLSVPPDPPPPR